MKSIKKHTVLIGGQKTSVSLEDVFWKGLQEVADKRGETIRSLMASIDANRQSNLSSAIRQFILKFYKDHSVRHAQRQIVPADAPLGLGEKTAEDPRPGAPNP